MDAIAVTIAFLLLMSLSPAGTRADTQPPKQKVALNTSLFPNGLPWLSPSGHFAFGFYQQGSVFFVGIWLVGVTSKTVVWTANQNDPPVTSNANLTLTVGGKLILTEKGQVKLIAKYNGTASFASMLDTGNFVLYNNNSDIIWQSFDHPTDTMLGGQSLSFGGHLFSSSSGTNPSTGRFCLDMQGDGNLVLYPTNAPMDVYWASGTNTGTHHFYINSTGLLQIRNNIGSYSKDLSKPDGSANGSKTIYRATLDFDGVLRLYAHVNNDHGKAIAWKPDGGTCEVSDFCGFNSYCTFNGRDQPVCNCLEGFEFKDANEETLGCKRNSSKAECTSDKDSSSHYNMALMNNIEWADRPYFESDMSHEEECSSACLADCNCWAALYQKNRCKKHGLPLRYVKRRGLAESDPPTVFLKVGHNSLKIQKPIPPPPPPIKSTSNKAVVHIIIVISVFTLFLCSMIAISSHYMYKIRVLTYKRLSETWNLGLNEEVALRRFSYNELKRATNHFRKELGKGAFGAVYKGALSKGRRLIAVKRLEKLVEEGEREFQAEVRAIGKTHHRNLVRLLGFCAEGSKRLLVYEYMSKGSLGQLIFGDLRRPDWEERVRIALNIARGILYLHEGCEAPIIHCDLKPENILMDEFWTAKISDFGLAKLLMPDQTRTFTGARGTRGYMAPEWNKNTPISVKADVYSYGIVLLETLCCRRNIKVNVSEPEATLLSAWAYKCFVAKELNKLVPSEVIDENVLENMIKVALWCIQDEPVLRPAMKSVVLMLEGVTDIAIPPCPNSNR
ncbi:G-type lectin S-receptor-like serine/threonine-protein kinase LECRK3 [Lotus japonicus]|uniref:G-type lectin S-receptor-like serine/threonine-protein kinase LECRK3 n=1 Tax=Lotus japonicus TaxID=34305 RepID=UPI00258BA6CA|nr:G-type lectin S-receptor-like serine/threonine-protein kinase LECRK3 [Lotus japonicus]